MKTICLFLLSLLLICAFSPALAAQDLSAIPASILDTAPGAEIEDYLELSGTPGGDWAFLLIYQDARRQMLCFRRVNEAWAYQSTVEKALPQGDQTGFFSHEEKGYLMDRLWDDTGDYSYISDGTLFGVYTTDGIIYLEGVSFSWQQDGFRLCSYQDHPNAQMDLLNGLLIFYNISNGLDSIHLAHLETRLEEVDFYALPRSPEQIRPVSAQGMTILPKEMDCTLSGEKLLFQKNQRCPVYVGPGTMYPRAGAGKAVVSTNDWIEVYGERNGWLLIRYELSDGKYRIGWIKDTYLQTGQAVETLAFEENLYFIPRADCSLTDDPFRDYPPEILRIPHGTAMELLAMLDGWRYVRLELNGEIWMGFI